MGDDFCVGIGREFGSLALKLAPQLGEVFNDAVMHHCKPLSGMRMRIGFVRSAVGRPTGVADADRSAQGFACEFLLQVFKLALRAPPHQRAVLQRGNAGEVVAAIFEALERVDQERRNRLAADYPDDAAHRPNVSQTAVVAAPPAINR